jgi:S-adenosylmethionine:tRNA ribosyltransferase-isomerase
VRPAVWPRDDRAAARLLVVDAAASSFADRRVADLPELLHHGDLLVVNDAATLPASLHGASPRGPLEVRLAGRCEREDEWAAVLFGTGNWRERTEQRPPPPELTSGDVVRFGLGLEGAVTWVCELSPRLIGLRFDRTGGALWSALYAAGRPVQYSHLAGPLALWHVQTSYAARPWAVEMPSAGRALSAGVQRGLRSRGVAVASLTHAAGLSATGEPGLDALLPLPERYEIPEATVASVARIQASGGRVIAVGTSVVRALEASAAEHAGALRPGRGVARLRIANGFGPRVVRGLLTGLHEPGTSHLELLHAFASRDLLARALGHAERAGYLGHEFGDVCLALAA